MSLQDGRIQNVHSLPVALALLAKEASKWESTKEQDFDQECRVVPEPDVFHWQLEQTNVHVQTYMCLSHVSLSEIAGVGKCIASDSLEYRTTCWVDQDDREMFSPITLRRSQDGTTLNVYIPRSQSTAIVQTLQKLAANARSTIRHECQCADTYRMMEFEGARMNLKDSLLFEASHVLRSCRKSVPTFMIESSLEEVKLHIPESGVENLLTVSNVARGPRDLSVRLSGRPEYVQPRSGTVTFSKRKRRWTGPRLVFSDESKRVSSASLRAQPNINAVWGVAVVEELSRLGVSFFFVAPGSRSTPLVYGLSRVTSIRYFMVHDERIAGFMALNYAKASGRPAAVVTTSGTAVANLFPSVVEASNTEVPMVLLTADRPSELRDSGAPQTIDQVKIFGRYTRFFSDVQSPIDAVPVRSVLSTIDHAIMKATSTYSGPVHLNLMFREKLAPDPTAWDHVKVLQGLDEWENGGRIPFTIIPNNLDDRDLSYEVELFNTLLATTNRVLVVAAGSLTDQDADAIRSFSNIVQSPVVPDVLSGLRFDSAELKYPRISYMDQLLLVPEVFNFDDDFIALQFGERIVSKRINALLSRSRRIVVSRSEDRFDDDHSVLLRIRASPSSFLLRLMNSVDLPLANGMQDLCELSGLVRDFYRERFTRELESNGVPSEALLAWWITEMLPDDATIFVSNSMPIRDLDFFGIDRGANGIDGIISSALGFMIAEGRPVTVVIGDMAMLHDLGALHEVQELKKKTLKPPAAGDTKGEPGLTIIVVNNGGGGIFNFLPVAKHEEFLTEFFQTNHTVSFADCAKNFNLRYSCATGTADLKSWGLDPPKELFRMLEVKCKSLKKNVEEHAQLQKHLVEFLQK